MNVELRLEVLRIVCAFLTCCVIGLSMLYAKLTRRVSQLEKRVPKEFGKRWKE